MEQHGDTIAALDALCGGQPFGLVKSFFVPMSVSQIRFYAGSAGKVTGQTVESNDQKFTYTRREPYGVVGQIIPWNTPLARLFRASYRSMNLISTSRSHSQRNWVQHWPLVTPSY